MSDETASASPIAPIMVTVVSADGEEFKIDIKLTKQSETLSKLIENFDYTKEEVRDMPVPLGNIKKAQVEKIIVWLNHFTNCEPRAPERNYYVVNYRLETWVKNFLNIPNSELFELVVAANYLSISRLYDAAVRTVASKISGKNADQICAAFNLKRDLA